MRFPTLLLMMRSLVVLAAPSAQACSSCGCTLSSDWSSQGIGAGPGYTVDLRDDYIDQTAFRHGGSSAAPPALPHAGEVERRTTNRYVTATLGYSPEADWGVNLVIPYLDRSHSTYAPGDTEPTLSHTRSLSDIKLIGRYQGFGSDGNTGISVGLKLPTAATHADFNGGPGAGEALDRSLQAGTGSTDLIVGAYRYGDLSRTLSWYAQGSAQFPVRIKDGFRPGTVILVNTGLRLKTGTVWSPQLQVNFLERRPDGGVNGDPDNSGGRSLAVSPGLSLALGKKLTAYGFVQLPVYRQVEGLQLAPRWETTAGISYSFR